MNTPPGIAALSWDSYPARPAYITWTDASGASNWFTFDLVKSEEWKVGATVTEHPVEVGADVGDHVRVALEKCEMRIRSTNEPIDGPGAIDVHQALAQPTPTWRPGDGVIIVPTWDNQIEIRALAGTLVGLLGGLSGPGGQLGGLLANAAAAALLPGVERDLPVQTGAGLLPPTPLGAVTVTTQQYPTPGDFVEATHAAMLKLKNAGQILQVFGTKQINLSMVIEDLSFTRNADTGTGEDLTIGFKEMRVVSTQVVTAPIPNLPAGGGKPTVNRGGQNPEDAPPATQRTLMLGLVKRYAPDLYALLPGSNP